MRQLPAIGGEMGARSETRHSAHSPLMLAAGYWLAGLATLFLMAWGMLLYTGHT
ncbi:hypothetical protein [Metapseudomonas furukawaii]|uniref:hypothetical protein n=1 Tax=Metapseudomonas furukawaii TaxID=1149133 RepID=UPI0013146066|nr:hypothetical protein [Pseudomonas furukawaii]